MPGYFCGNLDEEHDMDEKHDMDKEHDIDKGHDCLQTNQQSPLGHRLLYNFPMYEEQQTVNRSFGPSMIRAIKTIQITHLEKTMSQEYN